jgi:hypothetical protein
VIAGDGTALEGLISFRPSPPDHDRLMSTALQLSGSKAKGGRTGSAFDGGTSCGLEETWVTSATEAVELLFARSESPAGQDAAGSLCDNGMHVWTPLNGRVIFFAGVSPSRRPKPGASAGSRGPRMRRRPELPNCRESAKPRLGPLFGYGGNLRSSGEKVTHSSRSHPHRSARSAGIL